MKLRPLSREESRSIDKKAAIIGLSTLVLMENAGRGAAEILRREINLSTRVLIVCGPGNNGGDGAVVARHLDAAGHRVRIVWFGDTDKRSQDASIQSGILEASGLDQSARREPTPRSQLDALFTEADWVVDGLFGTGLSRRVEGPIREVIAAMNASGKPILALDLPSGLNADTGEPLGEAVCATITATFVAPKLGFTNPSAKVYTGRVEVVDIGVPRAILKDFQAEA